MIIRYTEYLKIKTLAKSELMRSKLNLFLFQGQHFIPTIIIRDAQQTLSIIHSVCVDKMKKK